MPEDTSATPPAVTAAPAPARRGVKARIRSRQMKARAIVSLSDGATTVRAGSQVMLEPAPSCSAIRADRVTELLDQGILTRKRRRLSFTKDHTFTSPSLAATVILGRSANGWREWLLVDDSPLSSLRN